MYIVAAMWMYHYRGFHGSLKEDAPNAAGSLFQDFLRECWAGIFQVSRNEEHSRLKESHRQEYPGRTKQHLYAHLRDSRKAGSQGTTSGEPLWLFKELELYPTDNEWLKKCEDLIYFWMFSVFVFVFVCFTTGPGLERVRLEPGKLVWVCWATQ